VNTIQKIAKNTFSLLISGISARTINFFVLIYIARTLGPGALGKISFAFAFFTYFMLFTDLGLRLFGVREVARDKKNINYYVGNIITIRFILAILSFAFLSFIIFFLNKPVEIKYLIILYGLSLFPLALFPDWAFQGAQKMEFTGLGRVLKVGVYAALVLFLIKDSEQLLLIPSFLIIGNLMATGILIVIFVKKFGKIKINFQLIPWSHIIRQAVPLGISIIMIQVIYNIDTVMLGFMKTNKEIGYYNAAYKIINLLILFGAVYFDAIFPVTSNFYKTSLSSLKKVQSYTAKISTSVALPLGIGGIILAKPIINLFYGEEYYNAVNAFQILIWVSAMIFINMIYARGMWACNRQGTYLKIVTGQAFINILLNFIFIPKFGIKGAAISTLIAEGIGFLFYYKEFNKVVYVSLNKYIIRPLIASGIMAIFLLLSRNYNIFILIFSGISIYFLSLYLFNGITKNDILIIKNLFSLKNLH